MEVNNLLCVGRDKLSQLGKSSVTREDFHSPDSTVFNEVYFDKGLGEKELIAKMSSKLSTESTSPPTKSILRGKVPSPKQESPSSLRNVRFCERESDDEVMYAKIHVNKNIQTEHHHSDRKSKDMNISKHGVLKLDFHEKSSDPKPAVNEIRTSTPRYSKFDEIPTLDFHTPRGRQEVSPDSHKSPRVTHSHIHENEVSSVKKHPEHERIVIDIDIDRKKPRDNVKTTFLKPESPKRETYPASKRGLDLMPDGKRIIKNMDLNESAKTLSPERKLVSTPDGNKIIQNMELGTGIKVRTTASQTSDSNVSSPRSASPETPFSNCKFPDGSLIIKNMDLTSSNTGSNTKTVSIQTTDIPDGNRIIQNLERTLDSFDSNDKMKSESAQTSNNSDGSKIIQNMDINSKSNSVEVQTLNPQDINKERVRTVKVQTDSIISADNSADSRFETSESRSVGVQVMEADNSCIPDGSKIIQNMEFHKSDKPKSYSVSSVDREMENYKREMSKTYAESKEDKKSLNDRNWNEFVRHLELFNPSSSSSSFSLSEEERSITPRKEPVLVYDRSASSQHIAQLHPPVLGKEKPPSTEGSNKRSARKFLESEDFTRLQYESVLNEKGLLSKLETGFKSAQGPRVSTEPVGKNSLTNVSGSQFNKPTLALTRPSISPNILVDDKTSKQFWGAYKNVTGTDQASFLDRPERVRIRYGPESSENLHDHRNAGRNTAERKSLGFTPIETYSFNPETLIKTASNRAYPTTKPDVKDHLTQQTANTNLPMGSCKTSLNKESVTKNAFVQGLDLGPVPNYSSGQRSSTTIPGSFGSKDMGGSSSDKLGHTRFSASTSGSPQSGGFGNGVVVSGVRKFRSASLTGRTDRVQTTGYPKSSHSYVTGHSLRHPTADSQALHTHKHSICRPSSAPVSRDMPKSPTLTSALKEMRSSAHRKYATSQFSDNKRNVVADKESFLNKPISIYKYGPRYKKVMEKSNRQGKTCAVPKSEIIISSRQFPLSKNYHDALHDKSNARPSSRERSRSRSRSRSPMLSPRSAYDKRYLEIKHESCNKSTGSSVDVDFGVKPYARYDKDIGSFESAITKGSHQQTSISTLGRHKLDSDGSIILPTRESRNVTRKPPLPSKIKTSGTVRNSRSRSRSTDRLVKKAQEQSAQTDEVKKSKEDDMSEKDNTVRSPVTKEIVSRFEMPGYAPERSTGSLPCEAAVVTIGAVPNGLGDPECMYLGQDTIQKIIDEAKL